MDTTIENSTIIPTEIKKKRNRFSAATPQPSQSFIPIDNNICNEPIRKSKWGINEEYVNSNGNGALSNEALQLTIILKIQLQIITDRILRVVEDAKVAEADPRRSPSPPPRYDQHGKRSNTREMRMRDSLAAERIKVIEELIKTNPSFTPPADYVKAKPFRVLYVPVKQYPTYNFIGLIIGPRGNTQRKMEEETRCKISVRGKGSIKEGSKGKTSKFNDYDSDELHIHIAGETEEDVERCAAMVNSFLTPCEDTLNEHKQKQLRELALINGTLKDEEYCSVCGEKGHKHFECPFRAKSFKAAGVKCGICGDLSHPTRDCPLKQGDAPTGVALDSEYDSFLAELGEGPSVANNAGESTNASAAMANGKPHQTIKSTNAMNNVQVVDFTNIYKDVPKSVAPTIQTENIDLSSTGTSYVTTATWVPNQLPVSMANATPPVMTAPVFNFAPMPPMPGYLPYAPIPAPLPYAQPNPPNIPYVPPPFFGIPPPN